MNWILEQCQTLLHWIETDNFDLQVIVERVQQLINALDASSKDKLNLSSQLRQYSMFKQKDQNLIKSMILCIKQNYCQDHLSAITTHDFRREKTIPREGSNVDYDTIWPDQIDEKASWFRNHFVGKPYITLIGPLMEDVHDLSIISIVKETVTKTTNQYRIIVRTKQDTNMGFIVRELDANELIMQLDSSGQLHKLDLELESRRHRPLRSFSSAIITGMTHHNNNLNQQSTQCSNRLMRACVLFLFQDINFALFKEFSAETTIMAGLEKEFLRYDEIGIPKSYKFGVLSVGEGQHTEEEWFSNSGISTQYSRFLHLIGKPVQLKDYSGYAAGLDTKTGESGEISFASHWRDTEIMYHVAALMPSRQHDIQQIHRKRYIGNDIVCIVFMEGKNHVFDPSAIRSQFLHVFILVQYECIEDQDTWRVEVVHSKNVKPCLPPTPSIFHDENELGRFLMLKLINAENASLKSDKFSVPNNKARLSILNSLIQTGLEASQVARSFSGTHGEKKHGLERPKSAGAQQQNICNSVRSMVEASRSVTPELPPIPSISRSSVLRDLKSLTRRKSNGQQKLVSCNSAIQLGLASKQQKSRSSYHTISENGDEKEESNNTGINNTCQPIDSLNNNSNIRNKHNGLSGIFEKFF